MTSMLTTANNSRAELLRSDKATLLQLSNAYASIRRSLLPRLNQLAREVAEARDRGETVNENWLRANTHYQLLIRKVRAEVGQFSHRANALIEKKQKAAIKMGVRHARAQIERMKHSTTRRVVS
jgi:hypothetical protein